jgi:hypothetical protein
MGPFCLISWSCICIISHMTKYSYPHIEDYIEIISGERSLDGSQLPYSFGVMIPIISLARYDVSVINNLAEQTMILNRAYTDRQAVLAHKLILKYERQLSKLNIDISPVRNKPKFRLPLRIIDRSRRTWIEQDQIMMKFPYEETLVDRIRDEARNSQGNIHFDQDQKVWIADLTEYNVNLIYAFSKNFEFEIDASLADAMATIKEVEKSPYQIQLTARPEIDIVNASASLKNYVQDNLGGINTDNLLRLVDHAPILGYSVDPLIQEVFLECKEKRFWDLCSNRVFHASEESLGLEMIKSILDYANDTQRWPIYVFEISAEKNLEKLISQFVDQSEIVDLSSNQKIKENTRVVHAYRIPSVEIDKIPLLITTVKVMTGGERANWAQKAEKIIYFGSIKITTKCFPLE